MNVCGLCGNSNGSPPDDFVVPSGVTANSASDFGDAWIANPLTCSIPVEDNISPCTNVDTATLSIIQTICNSIRVASVRCSVDPESYYNSCVFDSCIDPSDIDGPCASIRAYTLECDGFGIDDVGILECPDCFSQCPPNSYFALRSPSCEPTCADLIPQPEPCTRPILPTCRCSPGYVRSGDRCVLPSECGCIDNNRYYQLNDCWLRVGCTERCQCTLDEGGTASVICDPYECSTNSFCGISDGRQSCVCQDEFFGNGLSCLPVQCTPNRCQNGGTCQDLPFRNFRCLCRPGTFGETCEQDGSLCYVYGDPYFETFDGRWFDFQGVCEYSLVRACGFALIPFTISATTEDAGNGLSRLSGLRITHINQRLLEFDLTRSGVRQNGVDINLPFYSIYDNLEIVYSGADLWFRSAYFNVRWDWYSRATIEMRSNFMGVGLCGLCGNYDGDPNNDFMSISGVQVADTLTFGNNYGLGACVSPFEVAGNPCALNPANSLLAERICGFIDDPIGPFRDCPPEFRSLAIGQCERDVCLTGEPNKACAILDALTDRCLIVLGGPPIDWSDYNQDLDCPRDCPRGSSWNNCIDICSPSCGSIMGRGGSDCNYPCIAGCECDRDGHVMHQGMCIPSSRCGCYDSNGNYYSIGESYFPDCTSQCTCMPTGFPECVPFSCPLNAMCQENEDRSTSCVCSSGFIGDGLNCLADPCSSRDCNGGECISLEQITYCICPQGQSGRDCEFLLSSCYSYGDPHFYTFDGFTYDYHGSCSYYLSRTIVAPPASAEPFDVIQNNSLQPNGATITTSISINFPNLSPDTMIHMDDNGVVMNGNNIQYTLPWQFNSKVLVETNGIVIFVQTDFGLQVEWHYREKITKINLQDSIYLSSVRGLCSNFNGVIGDELEVNGASLTPNVFGDIWRVLDLPCPPGREIASSVATCQGASTDLRDRAFSRCSIIAAGSLTDCQLGARIIATVACQFDICSKDGAIQSECSSYAFITHLCDDVGFSVGNWRTGLCDINCPGGSQYSLMASACPRSCFELVSNIVTPCLDAPREGCECPDGYYFSGNECVLPEDCGCVANGVYFKRGESFFDDGCSLKCTCNGPDLPCVAQSCSPNAQCVTGANGRPDCVCNAGYDGDGIICDFGECPDGCNSGVCGEQNGVPGCICPSPYYGPTCNLRRGLCSVRGDPHYVTFDGWKYDFQGECSYYLIIALENPGFRVSQTNKPYGTDGAATTRELIIEILPEPPNFPEADVIELLQGRVVTVNGIMVTPPFIGTRFNIEDFGNVVVLRTSFDLEIRWDGVYDGEIFLDERYLNIPLLGLCGDFNGDPDDDTKDLFGNVLDLTPELFAGIYLNRLIGLTCEDTVAVNPCDSSPSFLARAKELCSVLIDATGPFAGCGIDEIPFYNNCVYDACFTLLLETDPSLCNSISVYAIACQRIGVNVNGWRQFSTLPCTPSCPSGSVFSDCTSACPPTCTNVIASGVQPSTCYTPCQEGCECQDGLVWQGGICIPTSQCGCFDPLTLQFYAPGSSFLLPGCQEECLCEPGGMLDCGASIDCHCNAVCELVTNTYQCVCPPPFVGNGFICEVNPCLMNNPCVPSDLCRALSNGGTVCECPLGTFGDMCELTSNECTAIGGEYFVSFDDTRTLFYGRCRYRLSGVADANAANFFEVQITLAEDNDPIFTGATQISSITVIAGTETVVINRFGSGFTINSQQFTLVSLGNLDIIAWQLLDRVIVFLPRGVIVTFTQDYVNIIASAAYRGFLRGLCGNYDGNTLSDSIGDQELDPGCPSPPSFTPCNIVLAAVVEVDTLCTQILQTVVNCGNPVSLLSQCTAFGCANYPDLSVICSFIHIVNRLCNTNPPLTVSDFPQCVPTCPPFAAFSTAISACRRTCNDVFPYPFCPITEMPGCECSAGRILNDVGECVLPAQCGCLLLGVYYEPNEIYYTPNCEQQCVCQSGGIPSCTPIDGCPTDATCVQPTPTQYVCQCALGFRLEQDICIADPCASEPCFNGGTCTALSDVDFECCCPPRFAGLFCEVALQVCKIFGNPTIVTFDNFNYHFIGGGDSCEYQLATGALCPGDINFSTVENFILTGSFVRGASVTTALLQSVTFTKPGFPEIKILQNGNILIEQLQVNAPVKTNDYMINNVFDTIIVQFNFGLNFVMKGNYLFIYLSDAYTLSTCGLCGNLNGIPDDDINLLGVGANTGDSFEMAGCNIPTPNTSANDLCIGASPNVVMEAEQLCNVIKVSTGPFSRCIEAANPSITEAFYENCRMDLCAFPTVRRTLCNTIEAFAFYCRNNGYDVMNWRSFGSLGNNCQINCPADSSFSSTVSTCPQTCGEDSNLNRKMECLSVQLETCQCDDGLSLQKNVCLQTASCGCNYLDSYLPIGSSVVNIDCSQTVTCTRDGLTFEPYICPVNGQCITESNVRVCQCETGTIRFMGTCIVDPCFVQPCENNGRCIHLTQSADPYYCICTSDFTGPTCNIPASRCSAFGDPNFITFDGESYEFSADLCEYFLTAGGLVEVLISTVPVTDRLTRISNVKVIETGSEVFQFILSPDNAGVIVYSTIQGIVIPPIEILGSGFIFNSGSSVTYKSTAFFYEVRVTNEGSVDVKWANSNIGIPTGLCGNNDGFATMSSFNQNQINIFGLNQLRPSTCSINVGNLRSVATPDCTLTVPTICDSLDITNTNSALFACFASVSPTPFYDACQKDLCLTTNVQKGCTVVASYAQRCRDNNIFISDWRVNTECAVTCPPNSFFDINTSPSPATCVNFIPPIDVVELSDVEACVCNDNFVLEDTLCIPEFSCGCTMLNIYFKRGETYFSSDCSTVCQCPTTEVFDPSVHCEFNVGCDTNAVCAFSNDRRSCVCNMGFVGDGLECFLPGCENSPCQNGGECSTRTTDPLDFFCLCRNGEVGQDCSIIPINNFDLYEYRLADGIFMTPDFGTGQYFNNFQAFWQFYVQGATSVLVSFSLFSLESDFDVLYGGPGFPTVDPNTLTVNNQQNNVLTLTGLGPYGPLQFASDSIFFFLTTDDSFRLFGFRGTVSFSVGPVPAGVIGSCFNGQRTILDETTDIITECETCLCDKEELLCTITDVPLHSQVAQSGTTRGTICNNDDDCASLAGSQCLTPSCLTQQCSSTKVCSSGNSLITCEISNLCIQFQFNLDVTSIPVGVDLDMVCSSFFGSAITTIPCIIIKCYHIGLGKIKRAADVIEIEARIAVDSKLKSKSQLEEEIRQVEEWLRNDLNISALPYVIDGWIIGDNDDTKTDEDNIRSNFSRPSVDDIPLTKTPWTYLLATLAAVLFLSAVGLTVAIFKYYKKQSNSFNAKFNPATPSYPTDNLPESLEMVKNVDKKDSIFARRIPLDDNTGNKDNIFALSWDHKEESGSPQSQC